ncbi:MAG: enoyl-CoA hydratase/isomerase family protein [Alphaproteobacteria bacterium]
MSDSLIIQTEPLPHVVQLSLNRPAVRNALNADMLRCLYEKLQHVAHPTRALLITAEGKHFCAGADLEEMKKAGDLPRHENEQQAALLLETLFRLHAVSIPVIIAAEGSCFGGALGVLAAADIVILGGGAKFCLSEVKLGLVPAIISPFLAEKTGISPLLRYALTAEIFNADRAVAMGLAHEVVEEGTALAFALSLAEKIATNAPAAVKTCKGMLRSQLPHKIELAQLHQRGSLLSGLRAGAEAKEGISAFFEKRPPIF